MATSLIQFGTDALTVTLENAKQKSTTVRLLTAKEFKDAKGLKGQEARKAYNDYLRTHGGANTAGLAAAMSSGELLVKSAKDYRGSLTVSFIKKSAIKDPVKAVPAVVVPKTAEEIMAMIAKLQVQAAALAAKQAPTAPTK